MPEIGYISNFNGRDFVYKGPGKGWYHLREPALDEITKLAIELSGDEPHIFYANDENTILHWRLEAVKKMKEKHRFVQIVITKLDDGRYHITWQDEHTVVRSMDTDPVEASYEVLSTIGALEVPDPKLANDPACGCGREP